MCIWNELLAMRPSLRGSRLVVVVLALIGGILGMHVMGMSVGSMTPASIVGAGTASSTMTESMPITTHDEPVDGTVAGGVTVLNHHEHGTVCGCSITACPASMDMHQGCVPLAGSAVVSVPLPYTFAHQGPGAIYLAAPAYKSADRTPDPPSLTQLSISRT